MRLRAALLVVAVFATLLYARTFGFSFSYLDDDELVLKDLPNLTQPSAVLDAFGRAYFRAPTRDHAYYRPMVTASFALDAAASWNDAAGYHATNSVLHAINACLALLVLEALGTARPLALFGALVFAAHPALAAAVAWIPGRDDLCVTLFTLAAWLALLRFDARPGRLLALAHGAGLFLALLSKETAVVLPIVLLAFRLGVERRALSAAAPRWLLVTWALAFGVYGCLRWRALGATLGLPELVSPPSFAAVGAIASGLGSLLLPFRPRVIAAPADISLVASAVAFALTAGAFALPGVSRPRLLFALGAFLLFLAPSLPASARLVLESRLYLPAIPFVFGLCEIARVLPLRESTKVMAGAFTVALLALGSWRYTEHFSDRLHFARMLAAGSPGSSLAQRQLGVAEQLLGHAANARRAYEKALASDPTEPLVHNNLAVLAMAEGKLPEAKRELEAELRLHPESNEAQHNLALVDEALGFGTSR